MRLFKGLAIVVALVLLVRYFPVIYYSTIFNDMVKQEAHRAGRVAITRCVDE
jgi:hypothetical protein